MIRALDDRDESVRGRYVVNGALTGLGFLTGVLTVRPAALGAAFWGQQHSLGLLQLAHLPLWVQVAAGVLLMDLTFYYWHRLDHTRPLLWRFHNVHHADPDMDVTTSFRFHWGEVLYSTVFRLLQVLLIGVVPLTYLVYEVVFNGATMFHHSNLRLPVAWERRLNLVFVTPRMHGVHHSAGGHGDQLQLFGDLFLVGPAQPEPEAQRRPQGHCHRGPRLSAARG